MAVIASDTFARLNQTGWGTASDGTHTYTFNGATQSVIASIVSDKGQCTNSTTVTTAWLGGTSADGEVVVRCSATNNVANHMGVVGRATASNNYYRAEVNGGSTLSLTKIVGGVGTDLGTASFTYAQGDQLRIKLRAQGSTISAKVWKDGNAEPGNWTLQATDTSITASGNWGIKVSMGSLTNIVTFDSLTITDLNFAYINQYTSRFPTKISGGLKTYTRGKFLNAASLKAAVRARFFTARNLLSAARGKFLNAGGSLKYTVQTHAKYLTNLALKTKVANKFKAAMRLGSRLVERYTTRATSSAFTAPSPYGVTIATFGTNAFFDPSTRHAQLLADLKYMGLGHVRFQQDWGLIESTKGTFNWTALDDMIGFCNANALSVAYPLRNSPPWATTLLVNPSQTNRTTCSGSNFTNDFIYQMNPADAATFIDTLTKRYNGKTIPNTYQAGKFLKLDGLEVGNEEFDNLSDCHPTTGAPYAGFSGLEQRSAAWWIAVAKQVIPAAKANIPDIRIGLWGMWSGNITYRKQVLTDIYNAKDLNGNPLAKDIDYWNFHFYKAGDPSVDNTSLDVSLPNILTQLGNVISSFGDTKKIRITEIGWNNATVESFYGHDPTGDPDPTTQANYYSYSLGQMQSSGIVEGFDFFSISYNTSGTIVQKGFTLNQPVPNPPAGWPVFEGYWPAATTIKNYVAANPIWFGGSALHLLMAQVHSKWKTRMSGLKTGNHSRFIPRVRLSGSTQSAFKVLSATAHTLTFIPRIFGGTLVLGRRILTSQVFSKFFVRIPEPPVGATVSGGCDGNATFTGIDASDALVGVSGVDEVGRGSSGSDTFIGIG